MNKKGSFVNLGNARNADQAQVMKDIEKNGVCPFCQENLRKYHKKAVLKEGAHWLITENQWPYKNTRVHLMAIHRQHVERLNELTVNDWTELGQLLAWAETNYGIESGGIGIRFGNPSYNGGTVRHLHVQLLTPLVTDRNNPGYKPVRLRLG